MDVHPRTWHTKLVLMLTTSTIASVSAQIYSVTPLQNQHYHQQALDYQHPQIVQERNTVSSYYDDEYSNNIHEYQQQHQQQVYHLPDLRTHPSQQRLERQFLRRPDNYRASQNDYDTDQGYDSNPLTALRDWWYETWDGTSRLIDTSYASYLWVVPIVGILAYDIMVPERLKVKRSADEDGLSSHESRLHTEALLLRAMTLLSTIYDGDEDHSSAKSIEDPRMSEQQVIGNFIKELTSGAGDEAAVEQEACVLAARIRVQTRDSPGLVVLLKRSLWLLQQTRPDDGALLRGLIDGLRGAPCSPVQHLGAAEGR